MLTIVENRLTHTLRLAAQQLTDAGCNTPQLDAELLLAHILDQDRSWLYRYPDAALSHQQLDVFQHLLQRRAAREPVAYIIGRKEFFALDFWVNQHVLIPRPETELLVETALEFVNHSLRIAGHIKSDFLVADIGTGSGCIAVSLAKYVPQAKIVAVDLSNQAIEVARQNAARHLVSDKVSFVVGNLLAPLAAPVDMIVSNPPYVSRSELVAPTTMPEVAQYEPRLALDGGERGLTKIAQLLKQAKTRLSAVGVMLMEIGFDQGERAGTLARYHFPQADVEIRKDLAGLDRLLVVENK